MKKSRIAFHLKASAATFALLCAFNSSELHALPTDLIKECTFIEPTLAQPGGGFRCCWADGSCSEVFPVATTAPSPTTAPAPTPVPLASPTAADAPAPSPSSTQCPTSVSSSVPGIGVPGFSHLLAGSGLFTTTRDTAVLECGSTVGGNVIPCPPKKVGDITKNCVLTGFDPPPMLRANVAANIKFPTDPIPFVALPAAGVGVLSAGAVMNNLAGSCLNPYKLDPVTGNMVKNNDSTINSPNKCPVKKNVSGLAPNSVTRPAPTPCPVGVPTCKDPDAPPDPPGTVYICGDPNAADGPVPNLATGCTTKTVLGFPNPYSYCHKNLSGIPQECFGSPCPAPGVEKIPGMSCGGAIPLLNPIPWDATLSLPQCPPDDWCIDPARSSLLRDGSIHISQGAPAGVYNITIGMGQNNLYVGATSRVYTLPAMGLCREYFPGTIGSLVLSEGYSYLISPSSIVQDVAGVPTPCYGEGSCDYSSVPAATFVAADYPIDYITHPYSPYGAISTVTPETYPTIPASTIPFINLATGTQVYFSLSVSGSVTLPLGGSFVTPTGGLISIPKNGWIASQGDGTTVRLGPGVAYMLDSGNMKVAGATCYIQLLPPLVDPQIVDCVGTAPPPASMDPGEPNVSIPIITTAVNVPVNTPLPPFTRMEYDNTCPPPARITLEGSLIEPSWCVPPTILDPTTGLCVTPAPVCPAGVIPYTGPVPPAVGDGLKCAGVVETYDCSYYGCAGEYCDWIPATCTRTGDPYIPTDCDPSGFIWCHNTQSCTYGVLGSTIATLCGTISAPAPAPAPAPVPTPDPCGGGGCGG